jgi:hypothetical protein
MQTVLNSLVASIQEWNFNLFVNASSVFVTVFQNTLILPKFQMIF